MKSGNIREKGIKRNRFEKKEVRENIFIFFFLVIINKTS